MRILITFSFFVFSFLNYTLAQQLSQTTQFMDNKLMANPGYAGSAEVTCVTCLHRSQWVGLDGAPVTSLVSAHRPVFGNKIGLGFALQRDQLGPTTNWELDMMYSYRIPVAKGKLGIGFTGKIKRYIVDVPSLRSVGGSDPILEGAVKSKVLPNFGVGLFYESPVWYAGISLLDIARNELALSDNSTGLDIGKEKVHLYAMTGVLIDFGKSFKLRPAALVKYSPHTPWDLDLNTSLIFMDKLTTGVTYRMGGFENEIGESIDLILQYQFNERIKLGMAYDFSLGMVKDVSSGTWEALVQYCFHQKMSGITNPRFF